MPIEVDGKSVATNENGFLENPDDWSQSVAEAMAATEDLALTTRALGCDSLSTRRVFFKQRQPAEQPNVIKNNGVSLGSESEQ